MQSADLVADLQRLSQPSLRYSTSEVGYAHRLAMVGAAFLRNRMHVFMTDAAGAPIAVSYQSDATPEIVFEREDIIIGPRRYHRGGYRTSDFLLDRFFATVPSGRQCVVFRAPMRLEDKTAMTHLTAAEQLIMYPWDHGCDSISIFHVVVDGALFTSLAGLLHRHHARSLERRCASSSSGEATLYRLSSWFVSTQCVNHSSHNSFKAGMRENFADDKSMKSMWGIIEGLRTCYSTLMCFARSWIAKNLVFLDWDLEHGYTMWTMLCMESEVADKLVALQLRCIGGRIFVSEDFRDDPDVTEKIYEVMVLVFRWRRWTDSRWLSVGDSARSLLSSILLGIEALVGYAIASGHSTYYLACAKSISDDVKRLAVKSSMVSFVADAVLGVLLTDDRLPVVHKSIEQEIASEVHFVLDFPTDVWCFIADATGLRFLALRSDAMSGTLVAAAALQSHFAIAHELPWSLCASDDIRSALCAFLAGPQPTQSVAWSIWQLGSVGYSMDELTLALQLMRNLPWSQVSTEQGHSAASCIMKKHRMYGQEMLQTRSLLRQLAVLCNEDLEQKKLEECRKSLAKLDRRRPRRAGGPQVFLSEMLTVATELTVSDLSNHVAVGRRIVARAGQRWHSLTQVQRERYDIKARLMAAQRVEELEKQRDEAKEAIRKQRSRCEEAQKEVGPMRVGRCRFSDAELASFAAALSEPNFGAHSLKQYRAMVAAPVPPPGALAQEDLMRFPGQQALEHRPVPQWLAFVAKHRYFFRGCVLRLAMGDTPPLHLLFLHAILAPRICVAFLPLTPIGEADDFALALDLHSGAFPDAWGHSFRFSPSEVVWSHMTGDLASDYDLSVLTDVCLFDSDWLGSESQWWSWDIVVAKLQGETLQPGAKAAAKAPHRPRPTAEVLEQHPWIQDVFARPPAEGHCRGGGGGSRSRPSHAHDEQLENDMSEDQVAGEVEDVFAIVQARRAQWAAEHGDGVEHFKTSLRGGAWTAANMGDAVDVLRCAVATAEAKDFCRTHQLGQSGSFSLSLYGEEVCALLAEVWVSRMTFLMETAWSRGDRTQRLTPADLEGFAAGPIADDLRARGSAPTTRRLNSILALKPGYLRDRPGR